MPEIRVASPVNRLFGMNVRRERRALDMTQKELEELSGVSHATISGVEKGAQGISLQIAVAIAHALGISIDKLLEEPQPPPNRRNLW